MPHARIRLVFSAYAEGEAPATADLNSHQLADAIARIREFADRHEGRTLVSVGSALWRSDGIIPELFGSSAQAGPQFERVDHPLAQIR